MRQIRASDGVYRTPVLMLTARTEVESRVAGLDAGALEVGRVQLHTDRERGPNGRPGPTHDLEQEARGAVRAVSPRLAWLWKLIFSATSIAAEPLSA